MNNPYTVLGIHPGASEKQISKAYRSLALLHHPDKSSSPQSAELFQRATEAYKRLMDPVGREEEERRVREAEERKRRREEMSEHRKQLQKELLERERAEKNKGVSGMSSGGVSAMSKGSTTASSNTSTTSTSSSTNANPPFTTTASSTTTQPNFNPVNPKYALLLKVSSASCPLPLTPETLSASLNLPSERITLQNSTVCAEFASAKDATEVLAKIPFDAVRSGDWYLGYPPVELFESDDTDHSVQKKVKVTEEFESEVLKRLRERAKSKK